MKRILSLALAALLAFTPAIGILGVVNVTPAHAESSYSNYWKGTYDWSGYELWEDCDWDGYDDHTGKEVPVGFDGTRGDNPNGPGANSQVARKEQGESYNFSGSTDSSSDTNNKSTKKSTVKKNTAKKETTKKEVKKGSGKDKAEDSEDAKDQTASETAIAEKILKGASIDFQPIGGAEGEGGEGEEAAFRPGGKFTVKAEGLKPNVEDIAVELHSDPIPLGTVSTDENGLLSAEIAIPENAPVGKHNIVFVYEGEEFLRQPVTLAAPIAAQTSAPADPIANQAPETSAPASGSINYRLEFIVGLLLLAALAALSAGAIVGSGIYRRAKLAR
jgi:hypothetical protein